MADRPAILSAKVEKLAEIIMDGNSMKDSSVTVSEARKAQKNAAREVFQGNFGSVASVHNVELPSDRL